MDDLLHSKIHGDNADESDAVDTADGTLGNVS